MNIDQLINRIRASNDDGLRLRVTDDMRATISSNSHRVHIEREYDDYVALGSTVYRPFRAVGPSWCDGDFEGAILARQENQMMDC